MKTKERITNERFLLETELDCFERVALLHRVFDGDFTYRSPEDWDKRNLEATNTHEHTWEADSNSQRTEFKFRYSFQNSAGEEPTFYDVGAQLSYNESQKIDETRTALRRSGFIPIPLTV
jgi:hypothetical protein